MARRRSIHAVLGALFFASGVSVGDTANSLTGLPAIAIPSDNPITPEKIALGKKLFLDRRLSLNNTLSCAMCHVPEQGLTQNELATSVGFEGKSLRRNAPSLLNVALHDSFQRDGAKATLEAQVWGPLLAHNEMANGTIENVISRINSLLDYQGSFRRAFAGLSASEITVGQAIASFERTLLAGNSRFDRWYFGGEENALSPSEQAGFRVFVSSGCAVCHQVDSNAAAFTDNRFHNTGVRAAKQRKMSRKISVRLAPGVVIEIDRGAVENVSDAELPDAGRFEVTGEERDRFAFKTPSLRNVALTAPYMHDGSMATLEEVVAFYAEESALADRQSGAANLTKAQRGELVQFLRALTGSGAADLAGSVRYLQK